MTTVTKKGATRPKQHGGAPYGNKTSFEFTFQTNASGIMTDSDQATAIVQTNVVRLGVLPAGFRIQDGKGIVSDAFTALTTAKVGFAYVDGVDDADVPQDDDYFAAALTTHTVGRYAASNNAVVPVTLPKDAYLILTVAGADHAAAGRLDYIVDGVDVGFA